VTSGFTIPLVQKTALRDVRDDSAIDVSVAIGQRGAEQAPWLSLQSHAEGAKRPDVDALGRLA
jgi:hypothetical protein